MSSNKGEIKIQYTKGKPTKGKPFSKDIIFDPEGQFKYPGQITRIPGGNITMKGIPFPVIGIPNNGPPVNMFPGVDYSFPDADYVDEIPLAKTGGWLDSYQEGGEKTKPNKESWQNLGETVFDQVKGMNFIKAGNQYIQGNYFQSIGELIKALPQSKFVGDYLMNIIQPGLEHIDNNYSLPGLKRSLENDRQKMEYVPPKTILPVGKKGGWLDNVK